MQKKYNLSANFTNGYSKFFKWGFKYFPTVSANNLILLNIIILNSDFYFKLSNAPSKTI